MKKIYNIEQDTNLFTVKMSEHFRESFNDNVFSIIRSIINGRLWTEVIVYKIMVDEKVI